MEIRDLKYLSALMRHQHFGRAAKDLGVTQPAITKAVQRLESEFGTSLFQRTTRGVVPTHAGIALSGRVRQIEAAIETTRREITDLATGSAGHVRIGSGATMAAHMLPQACTKLLAAFPDVTLQVLGDTNDNLFKALRNGELDLVVSALPDRMPEDLIQERLIDDELVVIARATHPLAHGTCASFKALSGARWALPPHPVLSRQVLDRSFQKHGHPPPCAIIESNSAPMLLETVARFDLITFQPRANVHRALRPQLREIRLRKIRWPRHIGISYRKNTYLPPAAVKLIAFLRDTAQGSS